MLADPQSLTISGNAVTLPRTGISGDSADYTSPDGVSALRVQQSTGKSSRRTAVTLRSNKIAADPLTSVNRRLTAAVSLTVTAPLDGFTVTELKDQIVALATALTASSAAMAVKVLGGEK